MARLKWVSDGRYHLGVSNGVLYLQNHDGTYQSGVAWNGLKSITETPTGGTISKIYADNTIYGSLRVPEGLNGSIEAYDYPNDFTYCNGSNEIVKGVSIGQQKRRSFGLVYKTQYGSSHYLLHLIYGANVNPGKREYRSYGDSPEVSVCSWDFITIPSIYRNYAPAASIILDSRAINPVRLQELEHILFGSPDTFPRLPTISEVLEIVHKPDIRDVLVAAISTARFWRWDPFYFPNDTVTAAILRESETRVKIGDEWETYKYPCTAYSVLEQTESRVTFQVKLWCIGSTNSVTNFMSTLQTARQISSVPLGNQVYLITYEMYI